MCPLCTARRSSFLYEVWPWSQENDTLVFHSLHLRVSFAWLWNDPPTDVKLHSISYKPITRQYHSDWDFNLGEEKALQPDQQPFTINEDFIKVHITSDEGDSIEYHAQVVPNPEVLSPNPSPVGLPLSVVIIGFDSVSFAQFQRAFPTAYRYMKDELQTVFLRGNTILGDGTTPALTALLTGNQVHP